MVDRWSAVVLFLVERRVERGVTIDDLAWKAGYHPNSLSRWERGYMPSLDGFLAWCEALGVKSSAVLKGAGL